MHILIALKELGIQHELMSYDSNVVSMQVCWLYFNKATLHASDLNRFKACLAL